MAIDYAAIRQHNIEEYGKARVRLGNHFASLYSDQTHFVYELLQNAEDAEATEVKFRLFEDRLEFEHDGRLFDENDVSGICGMLIETKKGDLTKIGKFGIGFKSVYVHTWTPKIHSGVESFIIKEYVLPYSIQFVSSALGTLFVFPFNRQEADKSFAEISERLQDLGLNTLLFLNHICEISYEIAGGNGGSYVAKTDKDLKWHSSNESP